MAYRNIPKNPRSKRPPLWPKETHKTELRSGSLTLTAICQKWGSKDKWRGLYSDVKTWELQDPEISELIRLNTVATDSKKRSAITGGRPAKEDSPENHDWKFEYCQELLKTKSKKKACLVTPYDQDEIYKRLNEKYTEYDRDFAEMVHLTEMQMVAWAEEVIWTALGEETKPKDRAWIAKEILKVRDRPRWGDKLDINMSGSITHKTEETKRVILLEASEDIKKLFDVKPVVPLLESGNIVDVEEVIDTNE